MGITDAMAPVLIKILIQEIMVALYETPAIGQTLHKTLYIYHIIGSSCQRWWVYFTDDEIKIQRD